MPEAEATTILNVNDLPSALYSITRVLQHQGYQVVEAATGEEALQKVTELPDLVVLDVKLPDIHGFEVCRRIKADPATAAIPVLHLSATYQDAEHMAEGLEGGADGYLTSPVEPRVLVANILALLRTKTAEQALRETQAYARNLVDSSLDMIIAVDNDRRITEFNQAAEDTFGYTREEVLGRHVSLLYASDQDHEEVHRQTRTQGVSLTELWNRRKNGEVFQSLISASVLQDERGNVIGMMGVSRDITEQKEAERNLALQARLTSLRAEIGDILSGEGSIREILQQAAESLNEYLGVAFYRIWTLNAAENMLELQASAGLYTHIDGDHGRVPVGKLKIGLIAEERRAHITNDVLEDPRIGDKEWARREGMVAFAGLPLIVEGTLVGVMATFSEEPIPDSVIQDLVPIAESLAQFISRRRAEEDLRHSEERFRQLAEHIDEVFWMTSADGREIIYVSPAYEEIWGTSRQSLYENTADWADAIHPEDRDRAEGAFFERASTGVFDEEYRIVRPDGTIRWIWDRGFPVKDEAGSIYRIAGIAEDITDRVQVMERLREARDGAESASKAKSDFLAMMSHEIRNPMTTIIGMTELALSSDLTPKMADYLGAVADSSYSLLELLNEILDLSRIESGKLELDPQPFSLHQNLEIAIAGLKERACIKGLSFSCTISDDVPDGLVGDAGRLRQVILNLADNAIKFTEQGEVTIEVELKSQDEEAIVLNFIVTDTGIGIDPDFQKQIFESFTQVETFLDRARGGAGLGLAIASRLVRLMGGTIHLDSTPGSGSVFSFETRLRRFTGSSDEINEQLAATPSAWSGDLSDHSLSLAAKPLSILLAEDDEMNQLLVKELIQKVGHRVDVVDNGIDVLQRVEENSYDLLLMDVQMPGLDGIEATRRIRESERGTARHVPIIALTAHAMESDRRRCIKAGMDAYLTKPIRLRDFLDQVEELVGGQSGAATEWKQEPAETGVSSDGAFSIVEALDVVYGDEDLLKDLASKFLQRYDELFIEIRQSIHKRDGEKLHREAHILKSLLANFAAQTPATAAAHLETCGRRSDWAEADTALLELDQAIEAMTPVLKDFISC